MINKNNPHMTYGCVFNEKIHVVGENEQEKKL